MRRAVAVAALALVVQPLSSTNAGAATYAHGGITLNSHRVVQSSTLDWCTFEDSSNDGAPCQRTGSRPAFNGVGLSYWNDSRNRSHYFWPSTPHRKGWRWVSRTWARNLLRSSDSEPRNWRACVIRVVGTTVIQCPDGTRWTTS